VRFPLSPVLFFLFFSFFDSYHKGKLEKKKKDGKRVSVSIISGMGLTRMQRELP
jgi:hypothetical protein